jgi:hypothetical protein
MLLNILGVLIILGLINTIIIVRAKEGWEDNRGFHEVKPQVDRVSRKTSQRSATR